MATWPLTLPQYMMLDGFSYTAPRTTLGSANDTGPPSTRRRSTVGYGVMSGSWAMLNVVQRDTFMVFHEVEVAGGAIPFTLPHPFLNKTISALFDPDGDVVYTPFGSIGAWRVDATLFVLPGA